jgi:5-methylthioadenosine/S-adenosylhomocysteine deaminase
MSDVVILRAEYVLAGPREDCLLHDAAVAVAGSRIVAIGEPQALTVRWPSSRVISLPDCLLMPGLVNAHQHGRGLSQIQLGYRDDFLESWIASRRGRGILDGFAITRLAAARMLANGITTTIHANYSYGSGDYENEVREQLRAYDSTGLRVTMCVGAMDRGSVVYPPHEACFMAGLGDDLRNWLSNPASPAYAGDGAATLALMARLVADFGSHPRIRLCYGPAGPQWVSDDLWRMIARDAEAKGLGMHMHALESPAQRAAARELFPEGVFRHLESLGAMTPRTVIAHGVWVEQADMEILARHGCTVVRNPGCNIRMRNGIAPLARYLANGVRVAIGTDNCAMGDEEDLLDELRLAGQLAREPDWNGPRPPSVNDLLAMATVNGAVAAQFGDEIGVIEPGRRADLVAFSLTRTREPYLDPDMPLLEAFLARARGGDARLTMVDGRILYQDGRFADASLADAEEMAAAAARNARRANDPVGRERAHRLHPHLCDHYREVTSKAVMPFLSGDAP